jgi:hypothetical protein
MYIWTGSYREAEIYAEECRISDWGYVSSAEVLRNAPRGAVVKCVGSYQLRDDAYDIEQVVHARELRLR